MIKPESTESPIKSAWVMAITHTNEILSRKLEKGLMRRGAITSISVVLADFSAGKNQPILRGRSTVLPGGSHPAALISKKRSCR
jgi:hypothetical protein